MSWVAVGIAGVGAATSIYHGISQNNKASEIEEKNKRPTMAVQQGDIDNLAQADQMARTGTPAAQYNQALNNINRNQAGGLLALSRSNNPSGGIASLIRAGSDATGQLDAASSVMRNRNLLNLMQQRANLARQGQAAWNYNYADKYSEGLAQSQALRGAGGQNIANGANSALQVGELGYQASNMNGTSTGGDKGAINTVLPGATLQPGYMNATTDPNAVPAYTGWKRNQYTTPFYGPYL